jgi:hypothetical protein
MSNYTLKIRDASFNKNVKGIFRFGIRLDHLWIMGMIMALFISISTVQIYPHDFWWHLKIGEWISTYHRIPTTQMFSWSLDVQFPYTYGAWLSEFSLYLLYRLGQIPLVIFTRNLLAITAYSLVALETYRRTASWRWAAVAILLLHLMNLHNLTVRPQIFSWIPFTIFLVLLSRFVDRQINKYWLLLCPLVMVYWVNSHGAFILGMVLMGIYFVGELIPHLLKKPDAMSWQDLLWLGFTGFLTLVSLGINPRLLGIFQYVQDLMTDKPSQLLITEWQSPTPTEFVYVIYYLSIILLIIALTYSQKKLRLTELLIVIAFLWLSWNGKRYVIWYGMAITPILFALIQDLPLKFRSYPVRNRFNLIILAILSVPLILVQPWFIDKMPLPEYYRKEVLYGSNVGPLLSIKTPVDSTEYLRVHPGGNLFNELGYGSYLIWAIPEQKVFIDTRIELYPYDQWMDYILISNGVRYNQILEKYGVDRVLLNKDTQKELSKALETDPLWYKNYEDPFAQIWSKRTD